MSIYDKTKMMCRTWIESVNNLFNMGKDLETEVDGMKGGIVKDVTLTEVDKHYTLTILYDDGTSDTVNWDDSTVGIEDITLNYVDGVYILAIELTDGTRYTFSIPVGDIVTQQELTALNLGTPDDSASSIGSLWARVKYAITTLGDKANTSDVNSALALKADKSDTYTKSEVYTKTEVDTLDAQNVKKTGSQTISANNTLTGTNVFKKQIQIGNANLFSYIKGITGEVSPSGNLLSAVVFDYGEYVQIKGMLTISDATPTSTTILEWSRLESLLNLNTTRDSAEGYWLVADNPQTKSGLYGYRTCTSRTGVDDGSGIALARAYTTSGSTGPWGQNVLGTGIYYVEFFLKRTIS